MSYLKNHEIKIHYEIAGSGEPLILIQGLGESLEWWEWQFRYFEDKMKVVRYDNRGVGLSERPEKPYTMDQLVNDLHQLIISLNLKKKVNLCGYSMGGMIAQNYVHQYPKDINSLILIATSAFIRTDFLIENIKKLENLDKINRVWADFAILFTKPFRDHLRENKELLDKLINYRTKNPTRLVDYENQAHAINNFHDTRKLLKFIKKPVLLLGAKKDKIIPLSLMKDLHEKLPNSELKIIDQAGHGLIIEAAKELNTLIWQFLQQI